jgi:midasin
LDKYLLGCNKNVPLATRDMEELLPLATREMEEHFYENCQLVDSLRNDMQVMRQQEISMRSVKEVLISRLEELLDKVCAGTYMKAFPLLRIFSS